LRNANLLFAAKSGEKCGLVASYLSVKEPQVDELLTRKNPLMSPCTTLRKMLAIPVQLMALWTRADMSFELEISVALPGDMSYKELQTQAELSSFDLGPVGSDRDRSNTESNCRSDLPSSTFGAVTIRDVDPAQSLT
jgi:hypothetical protein